MNFDYKLLVKYLIEPLTPEELESVMTWQKESRENKEVFEKIIQLKLSRKFEYYNHTEKIEKALLVFNNQVKRKSRTYLFRTFLKYAAVVLLVVSISLFGLTYVRDDSYVTYTVKESNEIKKISLDDGTTIWLNNASTLKVPKSFSAENRRVVIKGEAYFDVRKNLKTPFVAETEHLNVKVLGTSFNLHTHIEKKTVETILVSGKVVLENKNNDILMEMSPGERVLFIPENNECVVETIDVNTSTTWHLDQLKFESVTLREIVNKISIIDDVNVNLESKKLAERRFRCVINRDESLVEVLDILKYLARFDYRIEGDEVFINETK